MLTAVSTGGGSSDVLAAKIAYCCSMTTMSISVPDTLKSFVDEKIAGRPCGISREHVCELIRKDQDRQHLRQLLLDGAASAPAVPADSA